MSQVPATHAANPRLLLTGACGRLGPRLAPLLAKQFDLKLTDWRPVTEPPFPILRVNLLDFEQTCDAVRGVDAIAHLAIASSRAYKEDGARFEQAESDQEHRFNLETIDVNVKGTYHLFEAARRACVRRIVYISSMTITMGDPTLDWISEQTPPCPASLYACTKLFGEQLAALYARETNLKVICLRLGQPRPIGHPDEAEWARTPRGRAMMLGLEDAALSIECALRATHISFGVYNIVSESVSRHVDISAAERDLGYLPRQFCDEAGNMVPNEPGTGTRERTIQPA